ncbi:MAG: GntR family transcriptional regulator [Eubacteriales bacterium]|nr:GntR family transcriptional regulator [Eubacteriales bacterium]
MKEKSFLQLHAYDSIKNSILSGELEPGQLYSETKLSASLGVSRTPMREALQCLSQDGYITIIPSKGFMIRQLNEKDMKDSIEIRCAIEGFCSNIIASQIHTEAGRQLLRSLEQTLDAMEQALDREDGLEDFIYYDHQFHLLLVNYMQNDEFNQIFQRLLYLIHLTSRDALSAEGRVTGTVNEHREYFQALSQGKSHEAYQILIGHLMMPLKMHGSLQ